MRHQTQAAPLPLLAAAATQRRRRRRTRAGPAAAAPPAGAGPPPGRRCAAPGLGPSPPPSILLVPAGEAGARCDVAGTKRTRRQGRDSRPPPARQRARSARQPGQHGARAPASSLGGAWPLSSARASHHSGLAQGQAPMARRNSLRGRGGTQRLGWLGGAGCAAAVAVSAGSARQHSNQHPCSAAACPGLTCGPRRVARAPPQSAGSSATAPGSAARRRWPLRARARPAPPQRVSG